MYIHPHRLLAWLWPGSGLALAWLWPGSGLDLAWLWPGSGSGSWPNISAVGAVFRVTRRSSEQLAPSAMVRNTRLGHAMPCHAMPCHAMPCHAMPCHAMPCHAMPCHAMPCHAMPCHAAAQAEPEAEAEAKARLGRAGQGKTGSRQGGQADRQADGRPGDPSSAPVEITCYSRV